MYFLKFCELRKSVACIQFSEYDYLCFFLFFNLISLAFRMSKLDFLNSLPNLI
ncbi:hypothetical protein MGAS9429_Spy0033 [Streptococcus pyogenes MGAS9429]|uniref:Uncharacterized protein n=1 Tax=Streptococcus pyogenes serotype M12 (strain MGAS9429) TaxID=370551 RepID=Q1JP28_STRPC|nr:hypothetical protein MGAS9429_Spy0033 [Streptococcus pyogenes MGAS9429]ABF35086.1 hypothetical protein MGAS2096_Spy0034 [Streptococcus pyogenes MGAS2096]